MEWVMKTEVDERRGEEIYEVRESHVVGATGKDSEGLELCRGEFGK